MADKLLPASPHRAERQPLTQVAGSDGGAQLILTALITATILVPGINSQRPSV